jgi:hypothetical protein
MTKLENCEKVIQTLIAMGFRVNPRSRLAVMKHTLAQFLDFDLEDDAFRTAIEAERDMRQLAFICEHLGDFSGSKPFRDVAKFLTKDNVLPQDDEVQSNGRDAQFHLYIVAICKAAGLQPMLDKLDVRCTLEPYGIEAKRVKSQEKLEDRIKEAAKQIQFEGIPGMIALELTRLVNPENVPTPNNWRSRFYVPLIGEKIRGLIGTDEIERIVQGKGVFAVVGFDSSVINPGGKWRSEEMSMWLDTNQDDLGMVKAFGEFRGAFIKGTPTGGLMRPLWTGEPDE